MDLKLDTERKQLSGKVTIKLTNETEDTLQELCIRSDASHDMQIQNVIIEETKQKLELREKQEAGVFYADIASMPLQPGQSISLELDFVTEIPNQTPMPEISGTTMNETSLTLESSSYKPDILVYTELIGKGRFLFGAFSP